jgi:20S proteasome subunit alpha 2
LELDDAVHTAILTLKEGFEGVMDENNIDIGIISGTGGPSATSTGFRFRKLSPSDIKDYLVNIA